MTPKKVPAPSDKSAPPAPSKRFLIEKLEERIAPKKGGKGTHNCVTAGCSSASGSGTGACSGY